MHFTGEHQNQTVKAKPKGTHPYKLRIHSKLPSNWITKFIFSGKGRQRIFNEMGAIL